MSENKETGEYVLVSACLITVGLVMNGCLSSTRVHVPDHSFAIKQLGESIEKTACTQQGRKWFAGRCWEKFDD